MTQPAQYISGRTVQEQMNELISYVDTRAAEVATDAIASDVAQVHQDMLDADADAQAAAASAAAAAGTLANAVKKTGEASQSIEGDVNLSGDLSVTGDAAVQGQLSVIGGCDLRAPVKIPVTPTNNDDAASKKYVDDSLDNYAPMVRTSGNQTVAGQKTFDSNRTVIANLKGHTPFNSNSIDIRAVYKIPASAQNFNINVILAHRTGIVLARLNITSSGVPTTLAKIDTIDNTMPGLDLGIVENDGNRYICFKGPSTNADYPQLYVLSSFYSNTQMNVTLDDTTFSSGDVTFKSFGLWA